MVAQFITPCIKKEINVQSKSGPGSDKGLERLGQGSGEMHPFP
jgi:hypothetical protein